MSQDVYQYHSQDMGEFIEVLDVRIRKDQIIMYRLAGPVSDEPGHEYEGLWSINFLLGCGWNSTLPHTKEECEEAIGRLDWLYQKDKKLIKGAKECEF